MHIQIELTARCNYGCFYCTGREARRIKPYKLDKMLARLEALLEISPPHKVVVHTVDYGQDIAPLKAYLSRVGIDKHVVQPRQAKDDYACLYADLASKPHSPIVYRWVSNCRVYSSSGRSDVALVPT